MYRSKLISRAAALAVAALAASGLALAAPEASAGASATHHRPGIEGVFKVFDWSASGSSSRLQSTWMVYAKAGEVIHGSTEGTWLFASGAPTPALANKPESPQVRVRLLGPDGAAVGSCLATGKGAACEATATAPRSGVYQAVWDSPNLVSGGGQIYFRQDLWVTAAGVDRPGRVFAEQFHTDQDPTWHTLYPGEFRADGTVPQAGFYVLGDDGTLFEVDMFEFYGISSAFYADSVGIYEAASCVPSNRSYASGGAYPAPVYTNQSPSSTPCSALFLIFPDRPADDLPEALTAADGWDGPLYPRYQVPDTPAITSVAPLEPADPARPYAADVALALGAFKGTYRVAVDVNGDGDLADASDVVVDLEKHTTASDPVTWRWDGRDGIGQAVGRSAKPKLSVQLSRGNRYSLLLSDVESLSGGVRVEQLAGYLVTRNGGQSVLPNIHWDDTDIEALSTTRKVAGLTLSTAPQLVKTPPEGVAQTGHLHGWAAAADPSASDSWGNNAVISFNIWNDLSADGDLAAGVEVASRLLSVESKAAQLLAPASGARRIEYTVKVKNTGTAAFTAADPAVIVDTLPLRMDDWRYTSTEYSAGTAGAGAGVGGAGAAGAVIAGGTLTWSGPLGAGETATLRYSGRVLSGYEPSRINTVGTGPCPDVVLEGGLAITSTCDAGSQRAEVKLPGLKVEKGADIASVHNAGQRVRYSLRLTNVGAAPYTAGDPARVLDDLSGVLDDAVLDVASISPASAKWDAEAQTLSWSGPLAVGASQVIEYAVEYAPSLADLMLDNTASIHEEDRIDQTPGLKARVTVPGSDLHLSKQASVDQTRPGQTVDYTITLDNSRGQAAAPVAWTDDLSGVLDEAELTGQPRVLGTGVTVARHGDHLVLGGAVPAGGRVSVAYTVLVLPRAAGAAAGDGAGDGAAGDGVLKNALVGECADGPCPPPDECREDDHLTTCTPVLAYQVAKEALTEPPGRTPGTGDTVTFRLTFTNTGGAEVLVDEVDDLSGVLDDADVGELDLSQAGALTALREGGKITVSGPLPTGGQAVVSYSALVRPAEARGDSTLENIVAPSGVGTATPVGELEVVKSANPERAKPGEVVQYLIVLRATGAVPVHVSLVDDLTEVLDDGSMLGAPVCDTPSIAVEYEASSAAIGLAGTLQAGQEARLAYQVQVRPEAEVGDRVMTNVVLERGFTPADGPPSCAIYPAGRCTSTPVDVIVDPPDELALTGPAGVAAAGGLGAVLLAAGLWLIWARRGRRRPAQGEP
ncbi:MAG: hypothetical protein LBD90_00475 [Bifidobacteriaceae bacterium]|jgi:uncharacterized repeat protein (TIGR01451 family)|nr:hypothetical protein [Bifidobacteriaceae bacterium]